jgi:hypothetical protein
MRIQVVGVVDRGLAQKERLHLQVLVDTNLVYYAVMATKYMAGGKAISRFHRATYWFDSRLVRSGDQVIVYSGAGRDSSEPRSDGRHNHFFFWGLPTTAWNSPDDCAVLFEISSWMTSPYGG